MSEGRGVRAVIVIPGSPGSARLDEVPEQDPELGSVLVEALAVGVCGTDVEIAGGHCQGRSGWSWATSRSAESSTRV